MSKKTKVAPAAVMSVDTGWDETVLICRKCSKKLHGGFGKNSDESFRTVLRTHLREAGRRRSIGIIEVGCFGICPRQAVVIARSSKPGTLLVVGAGTAPAILFD